MTARKSNDNAAHTTGHGRCCYYLTLSKYIQIKRNFILKYTSFHTKFLLSLMETSAIIHIIRSCKVTTNGKEVNHNPICGKANAVPCRSAMEKATTEIPLLRPPEVDGKPGSWS